VIPDPERIRYWSARAAAYDRLCRRWDIFTRLSSRLVDSLPADLRGRVLDIGAGTGLTSELLLARRPEAEAVLVEPSQEMLALAREHLRGRGARFLAMGLDGDRVRDVRAVAAVASASMHFLELDAAFEVLSRVVARGGHVAFNLWWHSWEETADLPPMTDWQGIAEAACRESGLPAPLPRTRPVAQPKRRVELSEAASRHGFRLVEEHRDEDVSPVAFGLEFDAMDADWPLQGLAAETREALLARMLELVPKSVEALVSTRFLLQRTG
jgi:SAM-dependent methyltransferase